MEPVLGSVAIVKLPAVASQEPGLGTRTLRGMFWAYGSYVGGKLLVLVSVAILARLLSPADFGLVAFALVVTVLLDGVSDLGVSQALIIEDPDEVDDKADTAWTLGVLLGTGLMIITAALGPVAASFFDEPALVYILPILSLNFLLRALGITQLALVQKKLDFRTRTIAEMADVVVRGVVGIALALAGAGAYSLVIGYVAGRAATAAALWIMVPWRPKPRLHRADLSGLLRFGGGITLLGVISVVVTTFDYIAIGKALGSIDLGLYTLAWRLPELMIVNLSIVAGVVLFPSFSSAERPALAEHYITALRYMLMVSVPITIGLCLLAEPVVLTVFGSQWVDSIAAMRVLTLFALAVTLAIPGGTVYKAIGRVDVLIMIAVPGAALAITSIVIFVDQGIVAVAASQAGAASLVAILNTTFAARMLRTGWRRSWAAIRPSIAGGAALAAVLVAISAAIENPQLTLAAAIPAGAASYLGALWLIAPDTLRRLWSMALNRPA